MSTYRDGLGTVPFLCYWVFHPLSSNTEEYSIQKSQKAISISAFSFSRESSHGPPSLDVTMTAPVKCDTTQTLLRERQHLVFPHRSAKRPGTDEHYWCARPPVPIVKACLIVCFKNRNFELSF